MQYYCVNESVHAFFLLFRDLEEALSMGMDWSLREGTTGLFVGLFFFLLMMYSYFNTVEPL